jgi:hypothetical protein
MSSPKADNRRADLDSWIVSLCRSGTLAMALTACSAEPQSGQVAIAQISPGGQQVEECSLLGVMACKAAALVSGDATGNRQATCVASRSANGARFEKCGTIETKTQELGNDPNKAPTVSVRLAWADNSNNEETFVIERCDQISLKVDGAKKTGTCTGVWTVVGSVAANITSYNDNSVLPNRTYLYRVKAINNSGSSGYTKEELFITPSK